MSLLATYLNDHLAAATAARELAGRAAGANRRSRYGELLERLAEEIDEDRRQLLEIMDALDVGADRIKVLGGWAAEKLGRLKLNGRLLGYSPLSRVVELEVLTLGVYGKRALWFSLARLEAEEPALSRFDLPVLIERAEQQLEALETHRLAAVEEAMARKADAG